MDDGGLLLLPAAAAADEVPEDPGKEASSKKPSFAVVPGPFYNPNQGLGLMVIPLMMFHPSQDDAVSPASLVALAGMYAVQPPLDEAGTRYSYAFAAATRLYLDEDRWRVAAAMAVLRPLPAVLRHRRRQELTAAAGKSGGALYFAVGQNF